MFTTIIFDYTQQDTKDIDAFKMISSIWFEKTKLFSHMENLKKILGIARQKSGYKESPFLFTFASVRFLHDDENIINRYFGGGNITEKRFLFEKEISLLSRITETRAPLTGRDQLFHEYGGFFYQWRVYYSPEPLFYEGDWRLSFYPGGVFTPSGKLSQILRSALFTHVIMPSFIIQSKNQDKITKNSMDTIQEKRAKFLDEFSINAISGFQSFLNEQREKIKTIKNQDERVVELIDGYHSLLQFMESPFSLRREKSNINLDASNEDDLAFFHFEKKSRLSNDRIKCLRNIRILETRSNVINQYISHFDQDVISAYELLESRRNLIENRRNTLLTIGMPALGAFLGAILLWFLWR